MPKALTGSDVLAQNSFSTIAGLKIGFIGNHTSRLADGTLTHAAIHKSGQAALIKLFSPEHGAFGAEDHENVTDAIDPATGLPIYSLYGAHRKPTPEMLGSLDALVLELQDVGARFYTYASTMLLCLEAAAEAGIPLIVLDRPNPLDGPHPMEGPLPDADKLSFVVSSRIPVRHGLTLGEIARIAQREKALPNDCLQIIRCESYSRGEWWDETGLRWISPSPAMQTLDTATVYPGVCLLEQTNVSVGRGTADPFLLAGAPWIDAISWAEWINRNAGSGVLASAVDFVPSASKYDGERCRGVHLSLTDRDVLASVRLGIAMVSGLHRLHAEHFEIDGVNVLLASDQVLNSIKAGADIDEICGSWQAEVHQWRQSVSDLLLY